jgi:hypothetical protein
MGILRFQLNFERLAHEILRRKGTTPISRLSGLPDDLFSNQKYQFG